MNKQPCRLCSTFPVVSYSLLNTESGNMLESLTSIKVSPNDNLSATACFVCIFDLKLAYNIQQKILKVDKKFRHNLPLGKNNCESFNENSKDRNLDLELELNIERNIKEAREFINNLKNRDVFHQSLSQNISNDFENKSDNSAFCGIPEVRVKEEPKEYKLGINEELIEAQMMDYQPISDPLSLNEDINIKQEQFNTDDNCLGCGQSFPFSDYKKHENCTSESDITCSICNSVFQDTALYNYHFKMHLITEQSTENIEGPSVRDRFLDNSSCSSSSFEDEDEFDEKQQEWKCNACSKVFKTQENYDCHTLEKQQCSICHQKVPSLCYEKHVADHTSKKQKCTLCGVTLQHLGSLKNNLTQIDQMQTCQDCSKDLEGKNKFVIDEKMHLEIEEDAQNSVGNLLPNKSRHLYEKQFQKFEDWCKENKMHTISENVLIAYFESQKNIYKPSTLLSLYSMLRSCLSIYRNVDVSKYSQLQALLKRISDGYVPKKSNILEKEDINKFIQEADDRLYLAMKVILLMGYNGACRREELINMAIDDIEFKSDAIIVTVPKTKNNVPRIFAVTDKLWIELIKRYASLRPKNVTHKRFFLTYRNGKCVNSPIGINIMGKVSKNIATFLKLPNPELFTGHCFRRSSATHLANRGGDLLIQKCHGGWKSSGVAEGYVYATLKRKLEVAHRFDSQQCTNVNLPGCSTTP